MALLSCVVWRGAARCYSTAAHRPLSGIRVLDLTRVLAGPFCTMLLGDLGAEVIKIEKPGVGDDTRSWGPPFMGSESVYFMSVNRNKKSVTVNIKMEEGQKLIKELAAKCDILVENFIPGKLDSLGLGYGPLSAVNAGLIYCSITGFGGTGPYARRAGYDVIAAAMSGLMHITGPENGDPTRVGVAMTDLATGLYAHGAMMAALYDRQRTGYGQRIECNLLSTQVSLLTHLAGNYLNAGTEAKRWGTAHESIVPYQAFATADGWLVLGAGNSRHFKALCEKIGLPNLSGEEKYSTNELRVQNRKQLIETISERILLHPTSKWLELLDGCGFPYGPINSFKQVFSDPQVQHLGAVSSIQHPSAGEVKFPGPAVSYSGSPCAVVSPPPTLGEHTAQLLEQLLQYDHVQINSLKALGCI